MYKHQTIEYDKILPAKIELNERTVNRCRGEPHWHEEMQLIYVDEGSLTLTVGNRKHELSAGDVQLINPCEVHSLKKGSAKFISVHFSRIFVQSFFDAAESCGYVLEEGSQERREMIFLTQKLLAIEQNTFDEYRDLAKYSLLTKMLRLLLTRCCKKKVTPADVGGKRNTKSDAQIIRQYIEENYRRKILIGEIAELVDIATMYITPYFKKLMGKSFVTYLNEVRVNHSLDDYLTHDVPVCEAALKNGFGHYNHFTNACRKYYGASPTELKKSKRQNQAERSACLSKSRHRVFVKDNQIPLGICLYK